MPEIYKFMDPTPFCTSPEQCLAEDLWETSVFAENGREWTVIEPGGGDMIADLSQGSRDNLETAYLIASAPRLLAALVWLADKLGSGAIPTVGELAQIRAIIADARGQGEIL